MLKPTQVRKMKNTIGETMARESKCPALGGTHRHTMAIVIVAELTLFGECPACVSSLTRLHDAEANTG